MLKFKEWKKNNQLLEAYWAEKKQAAWEIVSGRRRHRRAIWLKLANQVTWLLVVIVAVGLVNILLMLPAGRRLYQHAQAAKVAIIALNTAVDKQHWSEVAPTAAVVNRELLAAADALDGLKRNPVTWLPYIRGRVADAGKVLRAGYLSAGSLQRLSAEAQPLLQLLSSGNYLDLNNLQAEDRKAVLSGLVKLQQLSGGLSGEVTEARRLLAGVKHDDLFWRYGLDLEALDYRLAWWQKSLSALEPAAWFLPSLLGYPEPANYLFVLQNRDELRPTGGFIGTYGLATLAQGEVKRLETHDIYHLDMPAKQHIQATPPEPIKRYLGQATWFMRDANWSPDWPTAAEKILWFYREENRWRSQPHELTDFDFIVALTPALIIDLIKLTGPVNLRGEVYNENNFVELLQTNTEKDFASFGFSRWDRKQIIGEIAAELQRRLLADLNRYWSDAVGAIHKNLNSKDILIWTKHQFLQDRLAERNWDGRLLQTDGDYLAVIDANMAALKTDAVMRRGLAYELTETADGLRAKTTINYAHLGKVDWKTGKYRSFTRIFVPQGSELLKVSGFFGEPEEVITGTENGKTWFGAFVQIEPGKIGDLSFEYKLPYSVYARTKQGSYDLLLQKQPGKTVEDLRIELSFKQPITTYQPVNLNTVNQGSRIYWKGKQEVDQSYQVSF